MKIVFIGGDGTGKTTLVREVNKVLQLPTIPEFVEEIITDIGLPLADIYEDPDLFLDFEERLMDMRIREEHQHASFISDRSVFDNIAYLLKLRPLEYGLDRVDKLLDTAKIYAHKYDRIILLPAQYARIEDDGVRYTKADMSYVFCIHLILKGLIHEWGLKHRYYEMTTIDLKSRVREALNVIDLYTVTNRGFTLLDVGRIK